MYYYIELLAVSTKVTILTTRVTVAVRVFLSVSGLFLIESLYLKARGLKRRSCEKKCGSLINRVLGRSSFPSPHVLKGHDVDVDLRLCLFLIK